MLVFLGNHKALDDGEPVKGKRCTEIRSDKPVDEVFADITRPGGIWAFHAAQSSRPVWVASDNADMATLLGAYYGCEVRTPILGEDT